MTSFSSGRLARPPRARLVALRAAALGATVAAAACGAGASKGAASNDQLREAAGPCGATVVDADASPAGREIAFLVGNCVLSVDASGAFRPGDGARADELDAALGAAARATGAPFTAPAAGGDGARVVTMQEAVAAVVASFGLGRGLENERAFGALPGRADAANLAAMTAAEAHGLFANRAIFDDVSADPKAPLTRAGLAALLFHAPPLRAFAKDLDQKWTEEQKVDWYYTSQGSQLVPRAFLEALEDAGSTARFFGPETLDRFGVNYGPRPAGGAAAARFDALNPGGRFPIGLALDKDDAGEDWVGLTCAACHQGQVEVDGERVRVQGGAGVFDIFEFERQMSAAFQATAADAAKTARFAARVPGFDRAKFDQFVAELAARVRRDTPPAGTSPGGPGRVDALTILTNEIVGTMLRDVLPDAEQNYRPPTAPADMPSVWRPVTELDWAQWIPIVHSSLRRNFGEVLGVYGRSKVNADGTVTTSADFDGLNTIEDLLDRLEPPRLTDSLGSAVDCGAAARGRELYDQTCKSCHAVKQDGAGPCGFAGDAYPLVGPFLGQTGPRQFVKTGTSDPRVIQTDPAQLLAGPRRAVPGPLLGALLQQQGLMAPGDADVPSGLLLVTVQMKALQDNFVTGFPAPPAGGAERGKFVDFTEERDETLTPDGAQLGGYKAAPLAGICLSGPYLHNGSVRTLAELLLPAAARAKSFRLGGRAYDLGNCGPTGEGSFTFDTALGGNSNAGHEFGTDLSAPDRAALLAYLKTL
jgi:cytochrome c5